MVRLKQKPRNTFCWLQIPLQMFGGMSLLHSWAMMKSCSVLDFLSLSKMENIHNWSKVMQISDTVTSDYSTLLGLEASALIDAAHLKDKQHHSESEKQMIKKAELNPHHSVFLLLSCPSLLNHSGQHQILTILLLRIVVCELNNEKNCMCQF